MSAMASRAPSCLTRSTGEASTSAVFGESRPWRMRKRPVVLAVRRSLLELKKRLRMRDLQLSRTARYVQKPSSVVPLIVSSGEAFDGEVESLAVPTSWTQPDIAVLEAEWLRASLQRWLDDEYCPEAANVEISARCARVYQHCLLEQNTEMADILMQMVRDLEGFSFRESFHSAFTAANAAVALITNRMIMLEQGRYN